jgi:pimeloyl-ACP methyl ester carboxylesterase/predicted glycosyltransferase
VRARYPDRDGFVDRDGVKLFYEVYGRGEPTVLLMPTYPIVHSRMWKAQIPYLARSYRVVAFDPRGNGRSDRPRVTDAYTDDQYVADTLAVMDETGTDRAILVALCTGTRWSIEVAVEHPDRVLGMVLIAPGVPFVAPPHEFRAKAAQTFDEVVDESEGWAARENRHAWLRDFPGWVEYHSGDVFMTPEPHSTKLYDDLVEWGLGTDAETLLLMRDGPPGALFPRSEEEAVALCSRVRCPTLVLHGTKDRCQPIDRGRRVAELTGGTFVTLDGAGHAPMGRHPVMVNHLIKGFVESIVPPPPRAGRWEFTHQGPKRALFLSSPIGLGHARRDLAIARELRAQRPDVEIHWLTQHPVTEVLAAADERVHPASSQLASESAHIESAASEHDIRVFQAIRDMDEILVANFHVVHDVLEDEPYDLVIGDEAWEVDHFLHENPELKRAPFAWLTDFVGWMPMPDGGGREAVLTADYNAEMIEHIARHPRVRDRSIFVGDPEDIVPEAFGPGLPGIREWTEAHYEFCGYVTGFDPNAVADRAAVREDLGYTRDDRVCLVSVGGSGVGEHLVRKVMAAYPEARRQVPELRMVVVAGPRIDPASLPAGEGIEVHGYVDGLCRHMAACDLAVVQGGLSTCMELTALHRPFLYFPLRHHFEQNVHVRHRLDRHRAGRRMDYAATDPDLMAQAIADEIGRTVSYLPVDPAAATRAAASIGELI